MELESDAKSEEKLTCGLENNMRNLANFMETFMGYFYPKQKMYELHIHMGTKDAKFEKELTSSKLT